MVTLPWSLYCLPKEDRRSTSLDTGLLFGVRKYSKHPTTMQLLVLIMQLT